MSMPTVTQINTKKLIFGPTPLEGQLEENKTKLDIFRDLKIGEKLGKQEDISGNLQYYKVANYRGLWLSRWFYGESSHKTIQYLDEDFTIFMEFLDRLLKFFSVDPFCIYAALARNSREFVDEILPGLYSLKKTYPTCAKMVAKVDSIILTLIDFKERTEDIIRQKAKTRNGAFRKYKSKEI